MSLKEIRSLSVFFSDSEDDFFFMQAILTSFSEEPDDEASEKDVSDATRPARTTFSFFCEFGQEGEKRETFYQ